MTEPDTYSVPRASKTLRAVKHSGANKTLLGALLNHRTWEKATPKTN